LLKSSDTVIFLSAITPDKGRDANAFMNNILMMKHLNETLKSIKIAHLIYFSSDAVYGQKQSLLSEDSPVAPQDLYGAMHLARELMLSELADIPVATLRITAVYGAGDTHTSYGPNRFLESAFKSQRIDLFGCGEELRDHIYSDDVAVITNLCVHMKSSGVLNIATGRSHTFKRVAELVAEQFDEPIRIQKNARSNLITHRHFDTTNLLKAFPSLCLTGLEDGLKLSQVHKLEN
jgi:nucleoside-diphosphate-sugar epimerase